jgi:hypothetical protein
MYIRSSTPLSPPYIASEPHPADGAANVATELLLTWKPGSGARSHNVYLGTSPDDLTLVALQQALNQYACDFLQLEQTYYWRVDEVNDRGTTAGTVWSFTTAGPCQPTTLSIGGLVVREVRGSRGQSFGVVTVTVVDNCGQPVAGVRVTGHFTGDFTSEDAATGLTDVEGMVELISATEVKKPAFSFVVDNLEHDYLVWAP